MQEAEERVAVGGVYTRRAGCLLLPLLPIRAAGIMIVTTKRIIFDPVFHYKLLVRKMDIDLADVREAEASGSNIQFNIWDVVSVGRELVIRLRTGKEFSFRSTMAEQLAEAINRSLRLLQG